MDKKKLIKLGLAVMMLGSLGMFLYQKNQTIQSNDAYEHAQQIAQIETTAEPATEAPTETEPETEAPETEAEIVLYDVWRAVEIEDDPYLEEMTQTNLMALRETNEDVVGWISIPDTKLDYPLMAGTEDDYYLKHTWEKKKSVAGSIFIENLCSDNLNGFNTVIYGHRMNNGTMFSPLKHYYSQQYYEQHPYVYIFNHNGARRYEIFSAYEAKLDGSTYQVGFADETYMQKFIEDCIGYSVIDTGVVPTLQDKIITLSTCTGLGYSTRWVVQARLAGEVVQKEASEVDAKDEILGVHEEG